MISDDRELTFPAELYCEVISHADINALFSLSLVSSSFYAQSTVLLYRNVDMASVPTLALSQEHRGPLLTFPHPASFIKGMELVTAGCGGRWDEDQGWGLKEDIKSQISAALKNINTYAAPGSLRSVTLTSSYITLPDLFGNAAIKAPALSSLASLVVVCRISSQATIQSAAIMNMLCNSPLTRFELDISKCDIRGFQEIQDFLVVLPKTCPNLQQFSISSPQAFDGVWDNPSFTFPSLRECSIQYDNHCRSFLYRHPKLEIFRFNIGVGTRPSLRPITDPSFLPNLEVFNGSSKDFLSLCGHGERPIKHLTLCVHDSPNHRIEQLLQFLRGLQKIQHLSVLPHNSTMTGVELSWDTFLAFTTSCPGLTTFKCGLLWREEANFLETVYQTVFDNILGLEHFTLVLKTKGSEEQTKHEPHKQAIQSTMSNHAALKTVQVDVHYVKVYDRTYFPYRQSFYFIRKGGILHSVPKLTHEVGVSY